VTPSDPTRQSDVTLPFRDVLWCGVGTRHGVGEMLVIGRSLSNQLDSYVIARNEQCVAASRTILHEV